MKQELVEISVDIHEADSDIYEAIAYRELGACIMKPLKTGDVKIYFNGYSVGIEIKRKTDFNKSLNSGRLHDQLARNTLNFDFPVLIIEGWKLEKKDGLYLHRNGGLR